MKYLPLLLLLLVSPLQAVNPNPRNSDRPNFLIIVTDDQRPETFSPEYMPKTFARVADERVLFTKAYVTTSLCCPSRASIFTGLLARNHGVIHNRGKLSRTNYENVHRFPEDLKNAGYRTGLIGKYLNLWNGSWRKNEFDYWVSYPSHNIANWFDYSLIKNDRKIHVRNRYITDKLLSYGMRFLNNALKSRKPFLLYFAAPAPHGPATPATRHEHLYENLLFDRPDSFNEADLSDKPLWMQEELRPLSDGQIASMDRFRIRQLQALAAVDEAIDAMITLLDERGALQNTVIIFLSDNSIFLGEHRLRGKGLVYEEAVHIPLAIRFPRLVPTRTSRVRSDQLVANIDIAPTIYELAGVAQPKMDGASLVPLMISGEAPWRDALLFEGWPDVAGGIDTCSPPFTAIRTSRYLYVETHRNQNAKSRCKFKEAEEPELYDLKSDPFEVENVNRSVRYRSVQKMLKERLDKFGYPRELK